MTNQEYDRLQAHIHRQFLRALGTDPGRAAWLSRASGVSESTISSHLRQQRYTLKFLAKVARHLGREVVDFFPDPEEAPHELHPTAAARAAEAIRDIIRWAEATSAALEQGSDAADVAEVLLPSLEPLQAPGLRRASGQDSGAGAKRTRGS